jgi:hypothetical protein
VFELKIFLINVVLPTVVMALVLVSLQVISQRVSARRTEQHEADAKPPSESMLDRSVAVLTTIAGVAALWLAFGLRVEFAWWAEDAWARIPAATAIVALGGVITAYTSSPWIRWVIRGVFIYQATISMIPRGEGWEFLQPSVAYWQTVMITSVLVGWFTISYLRASYAAALGFGWIACVAGAAFLAQDFLRVAEPLLAVASILGCTALATTVGNAANRIAFVAGPMLFALAAALASAQFNSYLDLPDILFWFAISSPAVVGVVSQVSAFKSKQAEQSSKWVVCVILAASIAIGAAIVAWTLAAGSGPVGGDDEWAWRNRQPIPMMLG